MHGTGVDTVLADETATQVLWALADNQGTVRDVVDGNGVILNHVTYDSFGKVVGQSNAGVEFRYGYTGREADTETGLAKIAQRAKNVKLRPKPLLVMLSS